MPVAPHLFLEFHGLSDASVGSIGDSLPHSRKLVSSSVVAHVHVSTHVSTHVSVNQVEEQATLAGEACGDWGGHGFKFSTDEVERKALWAARHSTYYAALALRPPNSKGVITDACVPISRLADVMKVQTYIPWVLHPRGGISPHVSQAQTRPLWEGASGGESAVT